MAGQGIVAPYDRRPNGVAERGEAPGVQRNDVVLGRPPTPAVAVAGGNSEYPPNEKLYLIVLREQSAWVSKVFLKVFLRRVYPALRSKDPGRQPLLKIPSTSLEVPDYSNAERIQRSQQSGEKC